MVGQAWSCCGPGGTELTDRVMALGAKSKGIVPKVRVKRGNPFSNSFERESENLENERMREERGKKE